MINFGSIMTVLGLLEYFCWCFGVSGQLQAVIHKVITIDSIYLQNPYISFYFLFLGFVFLKSTKDELKELYQRSAFLTSRKTKKFFYGLSGFFGILIVLIIFFNFYALIFNPYEINRGLLGLLIILSLLIKLLFLNIPEPIIIKPKAK